MILTDLGSAKNAKEDYEKDIRAIYTRKNKTRLT